MIDQYLKAFGYFPKEFKIVQQTVPKAIRSGKYFYSNFYRHF